MTGYKEEAQSNFSTIDQITNQFDRVRLVIKQVEDSIKAPVLEQLEHARPTINFLMNEITHLLATIHSSPQSKDTYIPIDDICGMRRLVDSIDECGSIETYITQDFPKKDIADATQPDPWPLIFEHVRDPSMLHKEHEPPKPHICLQVDEGRLSAFKMKIKGLISSCFHTHHQSSEEVVFASSTSTTGSQESSGCASPSSSHGNIKVSPAMVKDAPASSFSLSSPSPLPDIACEAIYSYLPTVGTPSLVGPSLEKVLPTVVDKDEVWTHPDLSTFNTFGDRTEKQTTQPILSINQLVTQSIDIEPPNHTPITLAHVHVQLDTTMVSSSSSVIEPVVLPPLNNDSLFDWIRSFQDMDIESSDVLAKSLESMGINSVAMALWAHQKTNIDIQTIENGWTIIYLNGLDWLEFTQAKSIR
ncbi:hypothetical protein SAMD00019534_056720 [Acytostelium subglobosum LB1]|uniref:hypothetical protein n=1 Tax=Acytostelium subglobosum LB1 TaxID=1410327 RepID=UPI000644E5D2|nr:hypothetical protein SAMD00019534_056720 [Acytostelium subglobosum LB1]GAM22497.1 hypothetical protein SAMD00019534_056720 [Acytostelium subglobosum LB1]|eukprot:XP_012754617.1 hypothetical protein SAMD00019534_056720 [Acytostelium subglobosum LB1]